MSTTTAHETTLRTAVEHGYRLRYIDDDCVLLVYEVDGYRYWKRPTIQIAFDNYSPSRKFVSAEVIGTDTDRRFGSYAEIRKFLSS